MSRKHRLRAANRRKFYHFWLAVDKPKKFGRLGQMNKHNQRNKRPSEFVLLAEKIEMRPTKELFHGKRQSR